MNKTHLPGFGVKEYRCGAMFPLTCVPDKIHARGRLVC